MITIWFAIALAAVAMAIGVGIGYYDGVTDEEKECQCTTKRLK